MKNYADGIKFGTAVTRGILDKLGSPDKKLKIVHIAGTNGKGSVAEFVTQILIAAGKRVGTFTSPAVFDYTEQFKIDGVALGEEEFGRYLQRAAEATDSMPTRFEAETAAALYAFYKRGCEYAVIECGMGGTYDATNAIYRKEVAVLTSVSLEHTHFLGDTVKEICVNKAGIIKNCPAVASGCIAGEARGYLKSVGAVFAEPVENYNAENLTFDYKGRTYRLSAEGGMQSYNAACAIEVARALKIDENAVYAGVKAAKPKGRVQIINSRGKIYVLDGGHNAEALAALAGFIKNKFENAVKSLIYGVLSDKDLEKNSLSLTGIAQEVIAVPTSGERGVAAETVAAEFEKRFSDTKTAESVTSALEKAQGEVIVICGSFTILKEAKQWIEKKL